MQLSPHLPLKGHARNAFPGDRVYVLDRPAGEYATGTEYTPLSYGTDNTVRGWRDKQVVLIDGREVIFHGKSNAA